MPVVTGGARLRLIWSFGGQAAFNVIGLQVIGAVTFNQGLADRVGSGIKAQIATSGLGPLLATATALETVGIRDLQTAGQVEFLDGGIAVPGTGVGDPLPRQTALVITHRTAFATRSGRGRTYFGGFTEAQNDTAAAATSALGTAILGFWNAMGSVLNSEQLTPAVIQSEAPEIVITKTVAPGTPQEEVTTRHFAARPAVVRPIVQNEVRDLIWDTQRRRNNGRGAVGLLGLHNPLRMHV